MFKFKRFWNSQDVRELCIKHQYYLWGDNTEYAKLMCFIRTHKPTDHNISVVAMNIHRYSDDDFTLEEIAEDVASIVKIHVVSE